MSEEVRGNQTQHEKDEKEGGGGSDEDLQGGGDEDDAPSPEEIQASLHQSEVSDDDKRGCEFADWSCRTQLCRERLWQRVRSRVEKLAINT